MEIKIEILQVFYSMEEAILSMRIIAKELEEGKASGTDPVWCIKEQPVYVEPASDQKIIGGGSMTVPQINNKPEAVEVLNDNSIITFGKHKGSRLEDVPDSWLAWWYDSQKSPDKLQGYYKALYKYVDDNYDTFR